MAEEERRMRGLQRVNERQEKAKKKAEIQVDSVHIHIVRVRFTSNEIRKKTRFQKVIPLSAQATIKKMPLENAVQMSTT